MRTGWPTLGRWSTSHTLSCKRLSETCAAPLPSSRMSNAVGRVLPRLPFYLVVNCAFVRVHSGILRLYSHQAAAVNKVFSGSSIVAATPTASGKSMTYLIPVTTTECRAFSLLLPFLFVGPCVLYSHSCVMMCLIQCRYWIRSLAWQSQGLCFSSPSR